MSTPDEGLYDNFASQPQGAAADSIYSTGVQSGVIRAEDYGIDSDDELDGDAFVEAGFVEESAPLRRRATDAGDLQEALNTKSGEFGWGTGTDPDPDPDPGGSSVPIDEGEAEATGFTGAFAANSFKLKSNRKKGPRRKSSNRGSEEEHFGGFGGGDESGGDGEETPADKLPVKKERSNSMTITKKKVSMADKLALLTQANSSSMRPKGRPGPKTAAPPVVPPNLQAQFLNQMAGSQSSSPQPQEEEEAEAEAEEIALPPRVPLPSLVSDSPADVYIGYLANDDEAVARKLAARIEADITKSDGGDVSVFLDRVTLDHLWIKATGKWRKRAGAERIKELISAKRYVFLITEHAVEHLMAAHREDSQLMMEMEVALESPRTAVPIFMGSGGTPFRGVNLDRLSKRRTFNEHCKENPRTILSRLLHRPCLKAPTAMEDAQEMDDIIDAIEDLVQGGYLSTETGKSFVTDRHFAPAHRKPVHRHHTGPVAAAVPAPAPAVQGGDDSDSDSDDGFNGDDPEAIKWGHWQLGRGQVEISTKIGEGEFGEVSKGILRGTGSHEGMVAKVAIKQLKAGSKAGAKKEFLREAQFMVQLHQKNLVNIYGVCTLEEPVLIVSELCEGGALKSYLPKNEYTGLIALHDLVEMMCHVATGMEYVEAEGFIHRDLAARNILVEIRGENTVSKVADLGLAVRVDDGDDFYQGDVNQPVPIRWSSPEAIRRGEFSSKSDVWSYGIVLYEIMTFGRDPYDGVSNKEVVAQVCDQGVRLPSPQEPRAPLGCPQECHEIMLRCWKQDPDDRPTFAELVPAVEALQLV